MSERQRSNTACSSCGVPWTRHLGLAGTCRNLESALGALKVIHTWASFRHGEMLTAEDTMKLCARVLKETAPNDSRICETCEHGKSLGSLVDCGKHGELKHWGDSCPDWKAA
jgi:exopolyphosphatase/pppGpp-phosphohydrolase